MSKKETAEQKLLRLIEASGGTGTSEAAAAGTKGTKVDFAKKLLRQGKGGAGQGVFQLTNNLLFVATVCVGVLLANEVRSGMALLGGDIHFSVNPNTWDRRVDVKNLIPDIPGLSFYLSRAYKRNIFQPFEEPAESAEGVGSANNRIAQKIKGFKLVGISWLDNVDTASVMIEDKEKGQTFFLKKGDALLDMKVKEIYADSTLLSYDNEEIMLWAE